MLSAGVRPDTFGGKGTCGAVGSVPDVQQVVNVTELCPAGMVWVWTPQREESTETVAPLVYAAPPEVLTFTVSVVPLYIRMVEIELRPGVEEIDEAAPSEMSSGKTE